MFEIEEKSNVGETFLAVADLVGVTAQKSTFK